MKKIRCAIYTRKSSEEGLEQDFNSLDAQREACEAYVSSQKHEGWIALADHYDDGGISGGTLERPALKRLMQDIDDGLVDQIVVYKIDRLTRSLGDFAKLVDRLDAANASFVSVTQSFNTATSMGRLTNPIYAGRIRHRDKTYEGLHEAIIEPAVWDTVQTKLQEKAAHRRGEGKKVKDPSPLIGKLFDETGDRFTPSHSSKRGKRHRYYVSHRLVKRAGEKDLSGWRLPALQLEQQIAKTMQEHLATAATPAMVKDLTSEEIVRIRAEAELVGLQQKKLFALIGRIDIAAGSLQIRLDGDAIINLLQIEPDRLMPKSMNITRPFQMRKRGVETKLIIGESRVSRRTKVTKKIRLISLLSKDRGVDVGRLSKKLGWQTHSTRAAMSGLRKSGYEIELTKSGNGKPSRYHISSAPTEQNV